MRIAVCFILLLALCLPATAAERNYLDTAPALLIPIGSIGCLRLGSWVSNIDSSKSSLIRGTLPGEARIQYWLAGTPTATRSNFLDSRTGSALTPTVCLTMLLAADLAWPQDETLRDAGQDLLLYVSGLIATKGITDLHKGLFARPRPLLHLYPELAAKRQHSDWSYDHHSFFSGHASGSFFAATFLNLRLRQIMRQELTGKEYRDWRWLSPTLLYGWASFVGWTRIHAYKHYLSDVLVGAATGWLIAELFYHLAPEPSGNGIATTPMFVRLSFSF